MSGKAEYRNAIRSRKLIKQAFVELLKEKDINKITVIDVVTKADINRGTFYAHYTNLNAVSEQIGNEIASRLFEFLDEFKHSRMIENPLPFLMRIERSLEEDIEFYRSLINSQHSAAFLNKLKMRFLDKILSDQKTMSKIRNRDQFIIVVNFFASGFVGLYHDWFNHKIKISLNDLTLILGEMIKNGLRPFIPARK